MNFTALSEEQIKRFYPFTSTRQLPGLRAGILTIREKHELLGSEGDVNPLWLPGITGQEQGRQLDNITELVKWNEWNIVQDFTLITRNRQTTALSSTNRVSNPGHIFIEEGAVVEHCIINADQGPVYIGKNALIMEGCLLRGPVAIGEGAVVKMGTRLYPGSSIGPYCTAGGEIKNSILSVYSNKAHDGYLGDSIIGEWCNLGAGTSNSNIKNTGGNIKIQLASVTIDAGNKFGLLMGDYSRAAINTSFNTGTVVGVCCNVFGKGLTPKYIPDFSWGTDEGTRYELPRALQDIGNWKKLRGHTVTAEEQKILTQLYEHP